MDGWLCLVSFVSIVIVSLGAIERCLVIMRVVGSLIVRSACVVFGRGHIPSPILFRAVLVIYVLGRLASIAMRVVSMALVGNGRWREMRAISGRSLVAVASIGIILLRGCCGVGSCRCEHAESRRDRACGVA